MNSRALNAASEFGNHFRQLRKARGFSQQGLAEAASLSFRHVNFLENGRSKPSREMVLKIANTLELSLKNTNVLLRSAGFSSVYRTTSLDDESMTFVKKALTNILAHHNPYPSIVMSPIGDLIMTNQAMFDVFSQFVPMSTLSTMTNIYEFMFTDDALKTSLVNWDELAPKVLTLIRQEQFENNNSDATQLLKRLEHASGLVQVPITDVYSEDFPLFTLKFDVGNVQLRFFSSYTTFGTPHDVALQELRIECLYPADATTREFCHRVAKAEQVNSHKLVAMNPGSDST